MATVDVEKPFSYDITAEVLAEMTPPKRPLIPGNTWSFRFRVANSLGVALPLKIPENVTLIEMWITGDLNAQSPKLSRKSNALRVGITPDAYQIVPDADQDNEVIVSGRPVSGKGFAEVFFDPGDRAKELELVGLPNYCVVVTWSSAQEETVLLGKIEIVRQAKD